MVAAKNPGNRRGRPNSAVPAPVVQLVASSADPEPPESLSGRGAEMWQAVWALGRGFYSTSDAFAVEQFCKLVSLEAELEGIVAEDGPIVPGSQGQPVQNPALRALMDVRKELRAAAKDLALNPRDRTMLGLAVSRGESDMERLLAKRANGRA